MMRTCRWTRAWHSSYGNGWPRRRRCCSSRMLSPGWRRLATAGNSWQPLATDWQLTGNYWQRVVASPGAPVHVLATAGNDWQPGNAGDLAGNRWQPGQPLATWQPL
eukprot:3866915-Prymnesium_polylepis.1